MYKVLIVEDSEEAAGTLQDHLTHYSQAKDVPLSVRHVSTAFDLGSQAADYDIIFMDIQLPGIDGMEAAQLIRTYDQTTIIIFVTNLAQYAVRGYEVDALDFIVKPVSYSDFALRMDKAVRVLGRNDRRRATIQTQDGLRFVPVTSIAYIDVDDHQVVYHLTDGERIAARQSLSKVEKELEGCSLVRISNSCLVNANEVHAITRESVRVSTGTVLYFSRSRRKEAVKAITDFMGGTR